MKMENYIETGNASLLLQPYMAVIQNLAGYVHDVRMWFEHGSWIRDGRRFRLLMQTPQEFSTSQRIKAGLSMVQLHAWGQDFGRSPGLTFINVLRSFGCLVILG